METLLDSFHAGHQLGAVTGCQWYPMPRQSKVKLELPTRNELIVLHWFSGTLAVRSILVQQGTAHPLRIDGRMVRIAEADDAQQSFQLRRCVSQQELLVEEDGAVLDVLNPTHGVIRPSVGYVIDVIVELRTHEIAGWHHTRVISRRSQEMGEGEQGVHGIAQEENSPVVVEETPYGTSFSVISPRLVVLHLASESRVAHQIVKNLLENYSAHEVVPKSWEGREIRQIHVMILDENGAFAIQVRLIPVVSLIAIKNLQFNYYSSDYFGYV